MKERLAASFGIILSFRHPDAPTTYGVLGFFAVATQQPSSGQFSQLLSCLTSLDQSSSSHTHLPEFRFSAFTSRLCPRSVPRALVIA